MDFRSNRFTCHYEFPSVYFICYRRTILITGPTVIQPLLKQAKVKKCRFSIKMGKVLS